MTSTSSLKTSWGFLLLFAATGQFFMAQSHRPDTLWIGLFFYALALWELQFVSFSHSEPTPSWPLFWEVFFFFLILGLACFFRLYHVLSLPAGMHSDQGLIGLCALRIEHEGWRPFYQILNDQIPEILLFYQLAAWFHLVGDSLFHFHLFFTLEALAGMALFYGTFRQLSGPRTALLSLLILSLMRWSWIETRTGYPSSETMFYLFGTLCFWIYGFRQQKMGAWVLSALFMGVGLYTYQIFKLVPFLFLIYAISAYGHFEKKEIRWRVVFCYVLIVLLLALPLLHYFWQQKTLGHREVDAFIGTEILQQKSLKPWFEVVAGNGLMFNRVGDEIARHNIPGHRMLDDITGTLFILGLALAFYRRKRLDSFYALTGFFVLDLAGLLSTDPHNSNRLVVLTAFVAFFAGSFLNFLWDSWDRIFPSNQKTIQTFLLCLLVALAIQNIDTYFGEQAHNEACYWSLGVEPETMGQTIGTFEKKDPGRFHYYITPFYFENHVVRFGGYAGLPKSSPLDLTALAQGHFPRNQDALFFLEEYKIGAFEFLKTLFPGGQETLLKNKEGNVLLYRYEVDKTLFSHFKKWNRGLSGSYWNSLNEQGPPLRVRQDPVLNFTSKQDFPFQNYPPFSIEWKGHLLTSVKGLYQIRLLTTDHASIWIEGQKVFSTSPTGPHKNVFLRSGTHRIQIQYQKNQGDAMALHLIWKPPHQTHWEMVPATAFGKIQ